MSSSTVNVRHQNLISWRSVPFLLNGDEDRKSIIRDNYFYIDTRTKMNNRLVHTLVTYLYTAYLWKEIDNSSLYVQHYCLLDCNTIQTGRHLPTFWKNLLPLSSRSETIMNIAQITDSDSRISSTTGELNSISGVK